MQEIASLLPVAGVERDEQAVATARRRAAKSGIGNVEFVCGDFR
jgi:protein-L-isoaspartate O-methyltransferase